MEFRILGPMEIHTGTASLPLGGPREQRIIASLLLAFNRPVPVERLVEAVWDEQPPATCRAQVQNRISALRRLWQGPLSDDAFPLVRERDAYLIRAEPLRLDAARFESLATAGQEALQGGDHEEAVRLMRSALSLWRGPALTGCHGQVIEAAAARLNERRLTVLHECLDHELALGRHRQLVDELAELIAQNPYHEPLVGQLMLALYRSGRQADALAAYRRCAELLAAELGIDPGPSLRRLHELILRADPTLAADVPADDPPDYEVRQEDPAASQSAPDSPPGSGGKPAELPGDVVGFVGRHAELDALDGFAFGSGEADTKTRIVVISGMAGVGKTALAVHWAHRRANSYPDGQLFVRLRGYATSPPVRTIEALATMLRALGVPPDKVPIGVDEAARMYRSLTARRRMLVILDSAFSAEQVRALIPGSTGSLVVITSRDRLAGLVASHGARRLTLDVLGGDESIDLLAWFLGEDRLTAEPRAAAELAMACGYLPLALRIAAANLDSQPHHPVGDYVLNLRQGDRLAALRIEGDTSDLFRLFDASFNGLSEPAKRLFGLLGLIPGSDFTAEAAALMAGVARPEAEALLDRLTAAHLVTEWTLGRYSFHDLLRLHARTKAEQSEPAAERDDAVGRLFDWYLSTSEAATRLLYPHMPRLWFPPSDVEQPAFGDHAAAVAWLDAERPNLIASISHAAEHGPKRLAWLLTDVLRGYFWLGSHMVDWISASEAGLAAARAEKDLAGQAAMQISLAFAAYAQGDYREAIARYREALELSRGASWREGEATALRNLGLALRHTGEFADAISRLQCALEIDRVHGNPLGQATSLSALGHLHADMGLIPQAVRSLREALHLYRSERSRSGEAVALDSLAHALRLDGAHDEAERQIKRALGIYQELGDPDGEASARNVLARIHHDAGRHRQALLQTTNALGVLRRNGRRRHLGGVLNTLAMVHTELGNATHAVRHHRRALAALRHNGSLYDELEAHAGLARVLKVLGDGELAEIHAERARQLARKFGYRIPAAMANW